MEPEKILNSQSNLEKENQIRSHHNPRLQDILQSCNHQDSMVLTQEQAFRSLEQNREPRNGPTNVWPTNLWTKQGRLSNGIKTVSSASGAGKTGQRHAEEWSWTTFLHHTQKQTQMDERPKCKTGSHQNPQGESRQKPLDLGCGSFLLNTSLEARETKAKMNYRDLIKIKIFCTAKETISKTRRQPTEWEKIFANELVSKSIKNISRRLGGSVS